MRPLRVLTWHVHGSYLYYLTRTNCEFILPVKEGKPEGYGGTAGSFDWGPNVREVAAHEVHREEIDVVLYQSRRNYELDRFEILSEQQRSLPAIHLEHDPPRESPTDTRHPVDDPNVLLVHVTHFNDLMWDSGRTPTRVIEHGVMVPDDVRYQGDKESGIVVVNGLAKRGRRLGADVFERVRESVPLELVGMEAQQSGGLGEVPHERLPEFISHYRFMFNPIRYTSLGLAVLEAMAVGLPIVALATTEMSTVIDNGENGYADTDPETLVARMRELIASPELAGRLSEGARATARQRFGIERFTRDWESTFSDVAGRRTTALLGSDRSSGTRRGTTTWTSR